MFSGFFGMLAQPASTEAKSTIATQHLVEAVMSSPLPGDPDGGNIGGGHASPGAETGRPMVNGKDEAHCS